MINKTHRVVAALCALCFAITVGNAEAGFEKIATRDQAVNNLLQGADYLANSPSTSTLNISAFVHTTDFAAIQPKIEYPAPNPVRLPKQNSELI